MSIRPIALAASLSTALCPALAVAARPAPKTAPAASPVAGGAAARTLRVTGMGRVSVRPDVAVVRAGAETTGADLARAVAEASAIMRRVHAALAEAGVPERDVRTTRHDVQVLRAWKEGQQGEITGYAVSDEIRVVVRDLAKLPGVLDRIVAAGANALRGLSFERDDPAPERREALARAVAQARAKADAIATASGVTIGEVLQIAEAGESPPIPLARSALVAMEGAPVSPGELEITAGVEVTYAIR